MFSLISLYFAARQQFRSEAPVIVADRRIVAANDGAAVSAARAA